MNLALSIERLPDSIRQLILTQPTIKSRYEQGETLGQILGCSKWAASWKQSADPVQLEVLKKIVIWFAGLPFEMETLLKEGEEQAALTGAEIRVAVARLRISGILYAVRKAWGDQLIYLPTDSVAVWQSLLLPAEGKPLGEADTKEVTISASGFRLPLCLELLSAWFTIYRQPIIFTAKGSLHRSSVVRMTTEMRLKPEELTCLSLTYPQNEQLPAQAALALDLGLCSKVLRNEGNEIRVCESGLKEWLSLTPLEADIRLHELVMTRYGSAEPGLHLTASVVNSLPIMKWFVDDEIALDCGHEEAVNRWLGLLESFGWLERGMYRGKGVFRKKEQLNSLSEKVSDQPEAFYVQPDGEILVPPNTSLAQRWMLADVAEKITADNLFVYRLTRNACTKAFNSGHTLQSITAFLEQGSGFNLPEPCSRALQDWFSPLGKVKFAEVTLLRTESSEVAATLMQDPEIAEKLLEQVGERDFIIKTSSYPMLSARLLKIGYPPMEQIRGVSGRNEVSNAAPMANKSEEFGWIYKRQGLSFYEADRTIPNKDDLFPGISNIPISWISQPRAYHASTRKELIQRAIDWQVGVQIQHNGSVNTFIPKALEEKGSKWQAIGHWKNLDIIENQRLNHQTVTIQADDITELMILLPSLEKLESI